MAEPQAVEVPAQAEPTTGAAQTGGDAHPPKGNVGKKDDSGVPQTAAGVRALEPVVALDQNGRNVLMVPGAMHPSWGNVDDDIAQNWITRAYHLWRADPTRAVWNNDNSSVRIHTRLQARGTPGGRIRWHTETMRINCSVLVANLPPNQPVEFQDVKQLVPALSEAALASYQFDNKSINARAVSSALSGNWELDRHLAEAIAPSLTYRLERYDNSALYAKGWVMFLQAAYFEQRQWGHVRIGAAVGAAAQPLVGAVPRRTLRPAADQIRATATEITTDTESGRFIWKGSELTATDAQLINQLALAFPIFQRDGAANISAHITSAISIPAIESAIYYAGDLPAAPNIGWLSSAEIKTSLLRFAAMRGEQAYLTMGLGRAIELVMGQSGGTHVGWFTATYQTLGERWPKPCDSNWMWRALNIADPLPLDSIFREDYETIASITPGTIYLVGALAGAILSTSVGLACHVNNLSGVDMNALVSNKPADSAAKSFMTTYTDTLQQPGLPYISEVAVSLASQFFGVSINTRNFFAACWTPRRDRLVDIDVEEADNVRYWGNKWGWNMPYFDSPFALGFALTGKWPSCWLIGSEAPTANPSAAFENMGDGGEGRWSASLWTPIYKDTAKRDPRLVTGSPPWEFIPDGLLLLNAVIQEVHPVDVVNETKLWGVWARTREGSAALTRTLAAHPWTYQAALGIIEPATARSYSWRDQAILAPILMTHPHINIVFALLGQAVPMRLESAGVFMPPDTQLPTEQFSALNWFASRGMGQRRSAVGAIAKVPGN